MEIKNTRNPIFRTIILASAFIVVMLVFIIGLPIGIDWENPFSQLDWGNPYANSTFMNPPFVLFFLPHQFLPLAWGNSINMLLNIVVLLFAIFKLKGGWQAVALTFTSPVFLRLLDTNNIEWLPLLGLLLGPPWGVMLIFAKPQTVGGVLLIWLKQNPKKVLVPIVILLGISFWIWGFWIQDALVNGTGVLGAHHNRSIFPVGLPIGFYLLWQAWKTEDVLLAAISTPLLLPYVSTSSLVVTLCLLACKDHKAAFWLYVILWGFAVEFNRLIQL